MKRKFFVLVVVFISFLFLPKRIFAACPAGCESTQGNVSCSSSSYGGSCSSGVYGGKTYYYWEKDTDQSSCGAGSGCPAFAPYCVWQQEFNSACGGCCWPDAPPPTCSLTNPLNPRVYLNETTNSSAKLRWDSPTTKGTELRVRLDRNKADVEGGCTGNTCLIKVNGLGRNTTSYNTGTVLSPGQRYYWRVINWDSTCSTPSATDSFVTDCMVSLSTPTEPFIGGTSQTITATVTANVALIDHVKFSIPVTSVASLATNPRNDSTAPYNVVVYGVNPGTTTLNANVYYSAGGSSRCATSIPVNVTSLYTLEAKAHKITDPNASCATIASAPALKPTDFSLVLGSTNYPQSATQNTNAAISIPNLIIGIDTITNSLPVLPPPYQTVKYCRSIIPLRPPPPPPPATPPPTPTPSYTITNIASGQSQDATVRFDVGIIKNTYTFQSFAHEITDVNATCADIIAAPKLNGVTFFLSSPSSANDPQSGVTSGNPPVTFADLPIAAVNPEDYLESTPPAGYAVVRYCRSTNGSLPTISDPPLTNNQQPNDVFQFDAGYVYGTPWVQVQGGDVTANTSISSPVPDSVVPASNRMFLTSDTANGVLAGLVTYGTTADFDSSPGTGGGIPAKVSSNTWLLSEQYAVKNYYTQFYNRFGAPTTADYFAAVNVVTKPVYDPDLVPPKKYYYVTGDMETSGDWTINTGESYVFIVNGNLTIKTPVTRAGTGFIAFIVSGTITVDSSLVGVAPALESPVVEGLYIANGTFATGATTIAGKEKFVGRGTFIAGNFSLERNLDALSSGNNARYPSELFIYDPQLPFLLPNAFKETSITWQEVAP